jgi:chorismate synthase
MDRVEILSGIFEGTTTGAPIALMVRNENQKSKEYDEIREKFRPGHADFTYREKYGIHDYRGGGRSSGRETLGRVAAGAVAVTYLAEHGITITGKILKIHGKTKPGEFEQEIMSAKEMGDSVGGIVEITADGCPPGLGDPVFGKLDALIAGAMMGIGAVKGVEIGDGFGVAGRFGSENNDQMTREGFLSNHAGGILGGISSGQEIVVRIAVKPTSSIAKVQQTRDIHGNVVELSVGGRHDPCIVPRIVPVAEAMLALVLMDCWLEQVKYQ